MKLSEYAELISLFDPYIRPEIISDHEEHVSALDRLIRFLSEEQGTLITIPRSLVEKRQILRAFLNQRRTETFPADEAQILDRILWTERVEYGMEEISLIPEVWKGDITELKADAVVNAANSDLLGCFHPLHACIDNAIHSAACPQLREDCNKIMKLQGAKEKTG